MASLAGVVPGFDANQVKPNSFEPIPAGDYPVIIAASEMKKTAEGNGQFLELSLQIVSGEYQNRKLTDRLNLINANQKAVDIAKGTLSAICRAIGVMTPQDSSELHNKPMIAVVKQKKREDTGEMTNEVKGYKARVTEASVVLETSEAPWGATVTA